MVLVLALLIAMRVGPTQGLLIGFAASSNTRSIYNLFFIDCRGIYTNDLDFVSDRRSYRNGLNFFDNIGTIPFNFVFVN